MDGWLPSAPPGRRLPGMQRVANRRNAVDL